jgi:uncharacterized protein YbaR (Trm112 family)
MAIDLAPELLDILACPNCHGSLAVDHDRDELVCLAADCGLAYPVRQGIPVLLIDEARRPGPDLSVGSASSAGSASPVGPPGSSGSTGSAASGPAEASTEAAEVTGATGATGAGPATGSAATGTSNGSAPGPASGASATDGDERP